MNDDTILFSRDQHVARITLNAPTRHNALGVAEIRRLRQCLHLISLDEHLRVLLLTNAGQQTFCAGIALDQFRSGTMSSELLSGLTDQLAALQIPVVCALNGSVFGGGAEMALCCDYRIGVAGMCLKVPAASIGICYPASGIRRFATRLAPGVATRILVASEEFDADMLLQAGFLHQIVPREQLASRAEAVVERIAGLAPLAVRAMKHILDGITNDTLDARAAQELLLRCSQSRDLQEGLAAQREKRSPRFSGE